MEDNLLKDDPLLCPRCGNEHFKKNGSVSSSRGRIQRYLCHRCGKKFHQSLKEQPLQYKQAYLDIETSHLNAPFGITYSWALKPRNRNIVYEGHITSWENKRKSENRILVDLMDKFKNYDQVITWYGNKFDIPFLRTRCLYYRLPFPEYKMLLQSDLWYVSRSKLKMHSNRLNAVAKFLKVENVKTEVDPELWTDVLHGTKREFNKAMKYIREHNAIDVRVLQEVHEILEPYYAGSERSV